MNREFGKKVELLSLAKLCQTTNEALFDFMDDRENKKGLPEIKKALRILRLFSTKNGNIIDPWVFGHRCKLTSIQTIYCQRYFRKNLSKFRLTVQELSEMISAESKKLKGKKEKVWRCFHFFYGFLIKCL